MFRSFMPHTSGPVVPQGRKRGDASRHSLIPSGTLPGMDRGDTEGATDMSIVIWPQQSAEWVAAVRQAAGGQEIIAPTSAAEALAAARDAEGWIGRLDRDLLIAAPRLRWLQSPSISLESIVFPELIDSDVTLTNMRNIYNDHIANHVLALFLAHCRDLPSLIRRQIAGEWNRRDPTVRDPAGMRVIAMRLGGIRAEVVRRRAVFGPTIIGVDPK